MAKKDYLKWEKFSGVHAGLDSLEGKDFLVSMQNFDSNVIEGELVSRPGFSKAFTEIAVGISNFICYRDEVWGKDVLILSASGSIHVFTKTLGSSGVFNVDMGTFTYGTQLPTGDLSFFLERNMVRIGGSTDAGKNSFMCGYIDRSIASGKAMFNDAISFNDFFLKKQQWVRDGDLFGSSINAFDYDSSMERWYFISPRGLEIRDSTMRIEKVLEGVMAWGSGTNGSTHFKGDDLYALGKINTASDNTKIIRYDISDNYEETSDSIEYTTANHFAYGVCTDGTNVFVSIDENGTWVVRKYSLALATPGTVIYTATGSDEFKGALTCDQTATTGYCYVGEPVTGKVHRFKKDGTTVYDSDTISDASKTNNVFDLDFYNARIYWINSDRKVYSNAADMTGVITTEKTDPFTLGGLDLSISIDQSNGDAYSFNSSGFVRKYTSATDWTTEDSWGGKISISSTPSTDEPARFYGLSIVDIFGQEHHLQSGMGIHKSSSSGNFLLIYVNVWLEIYEDNALITHDPTSPSSTWDEFRLIDKIRIYIAENSTINASNPSTAYHFLAEIDINDPGWQEVEANKLYLYLYNDSIAAGESSSITYTENSGLPESFKPYYTKWKYAKEHRGNLYYGNVRTDSLYPQQIIRTPLNSPDIAYQLLTNIDIFGASDGDEIKGLSESWQRLVVFKGNKSAIYNGLLREKIYNCGLQSPNSIVSWNNFVFFLFRNGIYKLTPSGYERISQPIDRLLDSESQASLDLMSATFYEEKEKVWFHVDSSDSYLYNVKSGTWDIYDLNHSGKEVYYVDTGIDGIIFFTSESSDKCYEFGNADTDDTAAIELKAKTHLKQPGTGFLESIFFRKFFTYIYGGTIANSNFEALIDNTAYQDTFTTQTTMRPVFQFLSNAFGSMVQMHFELDCDAETRISAMGVEFSTNKFARTKKE